MLQDGSYIFYSRIFGIREGKNWFAANDELGAGYTAELQAMCKEAARTRQAVLGVSPYRYRMDDVFFLHMACPVMNLYNREILGTLILTFNTKAIRQIVNTQESIEHLSVGILTDASGVILAMGVPEIEALSTIRLTLGRGTTANDVSRAADALIGSWRRAQSRTSPRM